MLCCIFCCLPAPQADLTRFRRVIVRWVSTAKRKTRLHTDFRSARRSKRINPLKITLLTQFLRRIEEEMLKVHSSLLATQFSPQRLRYETFISRLLRLQLKYRLFQRKADTLAVRIVCRATIISPTRGSQQRFVNPTWVPSYFSFEAHQEVQCTRGALYQRRRVPGELFGLVCVLKNLCWLTLVWLIVVLVSYFRLTRLYLKALRTELRGDRPDMDFQHLFFDSTEELSLKGYSVQWITGFERRALQKSVCDLVFLLIMGVHKTIAHRNLLRSA